MNARPIVALALWASGCGAPQITSPPRANASAPPDASAAVVASAPDASPDVLAGSATAEDLGPVHTVYTEPVPFTNKTSVELVSVRPACRHALVEVACAPPALTERRGGPPAPPSCPDLALDVIDYENGAFIERWVATEGAVRYFRRFDDVEGGRPLAPPAGFGNGTGPRCDDPHPASSLGTELERVAAHDERRIIESDDDPEMVVWKRWMKSARDGVPAKIDRAELTALEVAAGTAGWSPDGKHLYVSERWEHCLYDLLVEQRGGETKATRRSMCSKSTDGRETTYALSPDRRSAVRLTTLRDAPGVFAYALLDLPSGRTCKKGRLDVGPSDTSVGPALSDEGILWVAREPPAAPLLVDLTSGRKVPVDSPPRVGVRGALYVGAPEGPGYAKSAAVFWMGDGRALTTRITADGRTAVVRVDAHALLPEARGEWRAACAP